jgi:hypothetical protein
MQLSQSEVSMELFPNPVRDGFNLQLNNTETGKVKVRVMNMAGMVVKQFDLNKSQAGLVKNYLSIGDLGRGAYILDVRMNGWSESRKLIKE